MYTTILILMIIAAILLVIIVLMQNPKGGGISGEFGGSGSSQMFGVQKTGDLLEQLTWGFFAFIVIGALATSFFIDKNGSSNAIDSGLNVEKPLTRSAITAPIKSSATAPAKSVPVTRAPSPKK